MDVTGRSPTNSRWGVVTIDDLVPDLHGPETAVAIRQTRCTWHAPNEIKAQLPQDFCLSLDCLAAADGIRYFIPTGGNLSAFILQASLGGSAFLSHPDYTSPSRRAERVGERRLSYHTTRLLYQLGQRLREHFDRAFRREQDLYIPRRGRNDPESTILPDDLGLDPERKGKAWKPAELVVRGRQKAIGDGHMNPDPALCIRLGLIEAARLNPLPPGSVTEASGRRLVRLALYDLGPLQGQLDPRLRVQVVERLLPSLKRHLGDDTEAFNEWFFENTGNLIHIASKQKRPGKPLTRETVRQALLEAAFSAFIDVGECVHAQLLAFRQAVPEPLGPRERAVFDALYAKRRYLGGLPLILLQDRFDFLREVIQEMLQRPRDRQQIGILLRMLQYYGEMANRKRAADRDYKRRSHARNDENRVASEEKLKPEIDPIPAVAPNRFREIAAEIRELRDIFCPCGTACEWGVHLVREESTRRMLVLEFVCGCQNYDHRQRVEISWQEFKRIGDELDK